MRIYLLSLCVAMVAYGAEPVCKKSASDSCLTDPFPTIASSDPVAIFDRVTSITTQCFYNQTFSRVDWKREVEVARKDLVGNSSLETTKSSLGYLLAKLRASHTEFLTSADQRYWALRSAFTGDIDGAPFSHIGAAFENVDRKWFVRSVYEHSPAASAGLRRGDEIVSVDDKPLSPVGSFARIPNGQSAQVKLRRVSGGPMVLTRVRPQRESLQRAMLRGSVSSKRIFRKSGRKIGYFHLWAGTHEKFQESLRKAAQYFESRVDAMILDLRDGMGGASPAFLDPFFKPASPEFSKPLFVLINDGVKSGKESLAYLLKTSQRAKLVGTKTAGYYLGGRLFEITKDQTSLYLAVCGDSPVGVPLEAIGVAPDVEVLSPLPYSRGYDAPLRRAIQLASSSEMWQDFRD